ARIHSDRNTFNYFGFGNNSLRNEDDQRFNEVRMSRSIFDLGLQKRFLNNTTYLRLFPLFEWVDVQQTPDRFITAANNELPEDVFDAKFYVGGGVEFDANNIDNLTDPKQGFRFNTRLQWRSKTDGSGDNFSALRSSLTFYFPIDRNQNFVFATRVGGGVNFGNDYEFYHGQTIGGEVLRGYRNERFLGDRAFFHNNDLRLKIISSGNNPLLTSIGLHGGLDYGRVWLDNQEENKWHLGYGGGFWLAPVDLAIISFGYYTSSDDERFIVKIGHSF
ncbi:MAG: BamA/TamA family outer membrane protein, partial [Bacteroidota bacterium]